MTLIQKDYAKVVSGLCCVFASVMVILNATKDGALPLYLLLFISIIVMICLFVLAVLTNQYRYLITRETISVCLFGICLFRWRVDADQHFRVEYWSLRHERVLVADRILGAKKRVILEERGLSVSLYPIMRYLDGDRADATGSQPTVS